MTSTGADTDGQLRDALNAIAPVDLAVVDVESVADTFHARYDAISREYRYRIVVGRCAASPRTTLRLVADDAALDAERCAGRVPSLRR